jgi:hypothetical protein
METMNNTLVETAAAPAPAPTVTAAPEAAAAPAASTPTASPTATAPTAPAAPVVKGELPKTTGTTVGGWNRFAGYNPNEAKNKKNDRGDRNKGRR